MAEKTKTQSAWADGVKAAFADAKPETDVLVVIAATPMYRVGANHWATGVNKVSLQKVLELDEAGLAELHADPNFSLQVVDERLVLPDFDAE
jgi:hypothetical protein